MLGIMPDMEPEQLALFERACEVPLNEAWVVGGLLSVPLTGAWYRSCSAEVVTSAKLHRK